MSETVTVAEEEYLQTLFWLQEAGLAMTAANRANASMGRSGMGLLPSVYVCQRNRLHRKAPAPSLASMARAGLFR